MKRILVSVVAAFIALTASAATTITVADYAATNFITTDNHFSIATEKAASSKNAPAYNETSKDLRIYAGGTLTITAGSPMQSISFELSAKGKARLSADNTVDCGTLVCDTTGGGVKVEWTGDSKKVVLTVGEKATLGTDGPNNSAQFDFTALTIDGGTEGTVESAPLYAINFTTDSLGWTIDNKAMHDSLTYVWIRDTKYGYKASAYNNANYASESWLVSPILDLSAAGVEHAKMQFTHARKFGDLSQLSVQVTKDGTTWDTITVPNWPDGSSWTFFESGEVDLTDYISDKTQIAFVYTSSNSAAATWEIKTIEITEGIVEEVVHIANTPETAYTVTEAIALIEAGESLSDTVYVKGKVDSIGTLSEQYRNVTIRFNDGTNSMLAYNCYGLNKDSIMSQADLDNLVKIGDDIIVVGTLTKYGSLYELNSRCWLYSVNSNTDAKDTVVMYDIDFKASKKDWTIDDKALPESISYVWQQSSQYGYKASAYVNKINYATESWLLSPVLDLQGQKATMATLNFTHARKFGANEHLSVKITKDGTTWETLTFDNWPTGNDWNFIEAGAVDITKYISDKTQFAFVYTSTADGAATWEIGTVTLMGNGEPFEIEEVSIANTPETAYTVSEAIALIDAGEGLSDTVFVKGKVDSIGTLSEQFRNVTIRFNDGTKSMLAYNCFGLNRDSIMSQAELDDMVKIGDDIIVVGTLIKYGSLYEFNSRCWLYEVKDNSVVADTVVMYDINFKASKKNWTIDDKALPESISYVWQQSSQYGYKASAYVGGTNYATESWLLSPVLDLQGQKATMAILNFTHARKFGANEHLSVKITKDGTTWETLTFDNWPTGNDWNFIEAGAVDITKYISDKTQFAFVYTSTTEGAATWEIGSVTLIGDGEPFEIEEVSIANTPETAYTVSEAIALIDAGEGLSDTVYVKGKVDSIGTLSEQFRNVTIRFNDGTKSMLAYNCFGLNRDSIMSQAELDNMVKIGDEIIVVGTLTKYGSLYEFNSRCWLYSVGRATAIDNAILDNENVEKFFRNGVLYIRRNGVEYTVMGAKAE